jgi:cholesterol oxidase
MSSADNAPDYDVVVIGSGFGGSVSALRLAEKGYRVAVIGAGVGGGSLVYANTLYEAPRPFFDDPQWRAITDWQAELAPHYDQAKRMLGVTTNPTMTPADKAVLRIARKMGREHTFHRTPVGVHFGAAPDNGPGIQAGEQTADPYFGGAGPRRTACTECGSCMTGCRVGAKNMLTENYLYLAERLGVAVYPLTTVKAVRQGPAGYQVDVAATGPGRRGKRTITAGQVVFAAGTYGTQKLLHTMKATGALPRLSGRLGFLTRTNSEAILGVERFSSRGDDHSRGVAITSSFHPDDHTHIEPTRYGPGSNAMGALRTFLVDGDGADGSGRAPRWVTFLGIAARRPQDTVRLLNLRNWSRRMIVALVMQTRDNSVTVTTGRSATGWSLRSKRGHGEPNPTWIPAAHRAVRMLADEMGGIPGGTWLDLFNIPTTAHFIGGCAIGESAERGVIDPYHRVYGHPGLHVADGSAISANLGVNPSLTITAQAERAMSLWPNRGETDARPPLGEPYQRIAAVPPRNPAVPEGAPGALGPVSATA